VARAEAYLRTKWHLDPSTRLATTGVGRKLGGCCTSFWGKGLGPIWHNVAWPRPTSIPSGILIYPTVWPQYTNVTSRQDRQTWQTWQRSD